MFDSPKYEMDFGNIAFQHFRLFPRSLGEIVSKYNVQELHFSLTQGLWRYEKWGYPARSGPPGAELWAVFKGNVSEVSSNWQKLTNILSGQFCASLNFIDDTNTVIPKLSYRPEGVMPSDQLFNTSFIRYSALPPEIVCTENLTPFRKLLPCGAVAGLSTLLNALNIFNANFVSLAVDVRTNCKEETCSNAALELVQSVSVVFDPPIVQLGKQDWSFVKLFGSVLSNTCPVATNSKVFVDISSNQTGVPFVLNTEVSEIIRENVELGHESSSKEETVFAVYDLKEIFKHSRHVNIGATYKGVHIYGMVFPPVLYVDRKISGYGQEQGGIRCTFFNNHVKALKIIYFDTIPWYLRVYSHTLTVKNNDKSITPDFFHYQPAQDRKHPHHLELVLTLPPKSNTEMSVDFNFAFLKWTEYPPDANHGFYAGSAIISTLLDSNRNISGFPIKKFIRQGSGRFLRFHTQILLVSLPTPDFSMPYNVICLTCTVVALAFGPIHNITTKSLLPLDENKDNTLVKKLKNRIKRWWNSKDDKQSPDVPKEDSKMSQ
ncbi:GPI transamidase component PIG-T-like isoform X1 [Stegodyphus dumicola]|uniref:GPI transamidase component PIG-T-like isoform X1 n=1 Tax=Stegodyphus dumicola TaxID=202533 RepID=UPI0015A87926|nr:GPI transamidase component PIG-T-like isoform X1 [Stegodyphus dumicola]